MSWNAWCVLEDYASSFDFLQSWTFSTGWQRRRRRDQKQGEGHCHVIALRVISLSISTQLACCLLAVLCFGVLPSHSTASRSCPGHLVGLSWRYHVSRWCMVSDMSPFCWRDGRLFIEGNDELWTEGSLTPRSRLLDI